MNPSSVIDVKKHIWHVPSACPVWLWGRWCWGPRPLMAAASSIHWWRAHWRHSSILERWPWALSASTDVHGCCQSLQWWRIWSHPSPLPAATPGTPWSCHRADGGDKMTACREPRVTPRTGDLGCQWLTLWLSSVLAWCAFRLPGWTAPRPCWHTRGEDEPLSGTAAAGWSRREDWRNDGWLTGPVTPWRWLQPPTRGTSADSPHGSPGPSPPRSGSVGCLPSGRGSVWCSNDYGAGKTIITLQSATKKK